MVCGRRTLMMLALWSVCTLACCERKTQPARLQGAAIARRPLTEEDQIALMNGRIDVCYRTALRDHPGLAVDTAANYVMRNNQVVFVHVAVEEAPEFAQCVAEAIKALWPVQSLTDRAEIGMRRVRFDVNGTLAVPPPEVFAANFRHFLQLAIVHGALRPGEISGGAAPDETVQPDHKHARTSSSQ